MSFWQRWLPEDRETVRERYLATQKSSSSRPTPQPPVVQLVSADEELINSAATLGVTPLYLAVLRRDAPLVTKLLQRPKVVSDQLPAHCLPNNKTVLPFALRRLPQLPTTALELAIALDDEAMVTLLMCHGALLQIPKQLSLDQLADRSIAEAKLSPPSASVSRTRSGLAVTRGGGQLGALDSLGFAEAFLEDQEVQHTLGWRDYEAALLTQASPNIVEALLRRQGYQLTLNRASNPYELAQLFETAVTAGNAYVVQEMVRRGVDVNGPTFRRAQLPLCAATNALQVAMIDTLLDLGASLHADEDALWQPVEQSGQQPLWLPLPNACHMLVRVLHRQDWPDVAHTPMATDDLQRAACCVETLLRGGAPPGPRLVGLLEAAAPLAAAEPAQQRRAVALLQQVLGLTAWSPTTHIGYPLAFKKAAVRTLQGTAVGEGQPADAEEAAEEGQRDDEHHLVAQLSGVLVAEAPVPDEEDPLERERREIEAMFARASDKQVAALGAMVQPLSQWLGPIYIKNH